MAQQKYRVGKFECWIVGKMLWEVRCNGVALATASNLSDCARLAQRFYEAAKQEAA